MYIRKILLFLFASIILSINGFVLKNESMPNISQSIMPGIENSSEIFDDDFFGYNVILDTNVNRSSIFGVSFHFAMLCLDEFYS